MTASDVGAVRPGEAQDWERLAAWLSAHVPGLDGAFEPAQFHGGFANLTYLLRFGDAEIVVRRPPLGPVPKGAHDMGREHRVLCALAPHYDRAPRSLAFCADPGVIGAPFLAMERRRGAVIRRSFPPELASEPEVERRAALALIDALADLHALDPARLGLGDLGRPEGFAERQLAGWARRWEAAKDRDIPLFAAVHARLEATRPAPMGASVLHNDPKLDNCMFPPGAPDRASTVLDWDMATTGDPRFDLGVVLGYMTADRGAWGGMFSAETVAGDFPDNAELADRWFARLGAAETRVDWFEGFALWKTAVVLQQIYIRFLRGQTEDPRFEDLGPRVPELIEKAAAGLQL